MNTTWITKNLSKEDCFRFALSLLTFGSLAIAFSAAKHIPQDCISYLVSFAEYAVLAF